MIFLLITVSKMIDIFHIAYQYFQKSDSCDCPWDRLNHELFSNYSLLKKTIKNRYLAISWSLWFIKWLAVVVHWYRWIDYLWVIVIQANASICREDLTLSSLGRLLWALGFDFFGRDFRGREIVMGSDRSPIWILLGLEITRVSFDFIDAVRKCFDISV